MDTNSIFLFIVGILGIFLSLSLGRRALYTNNPDKIFYFGVAALFSAAAGVLALSLFFGTFGGN